MPFFYGLTDLGYMLHLYYNREVNNMIKRAIITLALTSAMLFSISNIAKAQCLQTINLKSKTLLTK